MNFFLEPHRISSWSKMMRVLASPLQHYLQKHEQDFTDIAKIVSAGSFTLRKNFYYRFFMQQNDFDMKIRCVFFKLLSLA
jgi:hypothetical protein